MCVDRQGGGRCSAVKKMQQLSEILVSQFSDSLNFIGSGPHKCFPVQHVLQKEILPACGQGTHKEIGAYDRNLLGKGEHWSR